MIFHQLVEPGDLTSGGSYNCVKGENITLNHSFISHLTHIRWFIYPLYSLSGLYYPSYLGSAMAGKKPVDKVSKGLTSLVDEFTAAVKEMVNAGEETVVHLAVGGGRVISAVIDATGQVTKVGIETAGNVVGTLGSSVVKVVTGQSGKELAIEENEEKMESE
jgi:hypothetical protein